MSLAVATRKFGTDLSNLQQRNGVAKKPIQKKSTTVTKKNVTTLKPSEPAAVVEKKEVAVATANLEKREEISERKYTRDFLLLFQSSCVEPIPGLLPEILRSNAKPSWRAEPAAESPIKTVEPSAGQTPSSPTQSKAHVEWRPKPKKEKPRETDPKRLAARQKQIDIGMNTLGYKRFLEMVPEEMRSKVLKIPDINQVCSKRSWDGQVRKWRRMLHLWDPSEPASAILEGEDLDIEEDEDDEDAISPEFLKQYLPPQSQPIQVA